MMTKVFPLLILFNLMYLITHGQDNQKTVDRLDSQIEQLEADMNKKIELEDYFGAAAIKKELKKLKENQVKAKAAIKANKTIGAGQSSLDPQIARLEADLNKKIELEDYLGADAIKKELKKVKENQAKAEKAQQEEARLAQEKKEQELLKEQARIAEEKKKEAAEALAKAKAEKARQEEEARLAQEKKEQELLEEQARIEAEKKEKALALAKAESEKKKAEENEAKRIAEEKAATEKARLEEARLAQEQAKAKVAIGANQSGLNPQIARLEADLNKKIELEDYLAAAAIKKELKKLKETQAKANVPIKADKTISADQNEIDQQIMELEADLNKQLELIEELKATQANAKVEELVENALKKREPEESKKTVETTYTKTATPTSETLKYNATESIFSESFGGATSLFHTSSTDDDWRNPHVGAYESRQSGRLEHGFSYTTVPMDLDEARDFLIETDALYIAGSYTNPMGLIWQRVGDVFFVFTINKKRDVRVSEYKKGELKREYVAVDNCEFVKVSWKNKLSILKRQGKWVFAVNDMVVGEIDRQGVHGNEVGFILPKNATTRFDNFKVQYVD